MNLVLPIHLLLFAVAATPLAQAPPSPSEESGSGRIVYELARLRDFDDVRLPAAIVVAVVAALVALVWYLYRRDTRELRRPVRLSLAALRLVALGGLLAFFLGIERRTTVEVVHNSQVVVLVDVSQSMGLTDSDSPSTGIDGARQTRLDRVRATLEGGPLIDRLLQDHDVTIARFDQDLEPVVTLPRRAVESATLAVLPESPPGDEGSAASADAAPHLDGEGSGRGDWAEALQPRGTETRLGSALVDQLRLYRRSPLAGIVVVSDGAQNAGISPGTAAAAANESNVPLFPIGVGSAEKRRHIALRDMIMPSRAFPGDTFNVTGYIQANGYAGRIIDVQLLRRRPEDASAPDSSIASERVAVGADGEMVAVSFDIEPEEAGSFVYQLRIVLPADDDDPRDNQREAELEVVDRQTRVLLFASGPTRDYHFLRDQLHRDKTMTVDVLLQTAQPGMSQDSHQILAEFPTSREELYEYDCLVAFDPDWTKLDASQVALLESWVSNEAGGLLVVAGPIHTARWVRSVEHAKIRDLYPVTFQQRLTLLDDGQFSGTTPWPLLLERAGREAKFLWLENTAEDSELAWEQFPGVYGYYGVKGEKPGATVYARFSDPEAGSGGQRPVWLASHFYGGGQVMYIGSGELWRLRRVDPAYFEVLYTKLIRHVSQGRILRGSSRGSLLVERDRFELGETVVVRARLSDQQHNPIDVDSVAAHAVRPDGATEPIRLVADPSQPGMYVGQLAVLQEGTYQILLAVPDSQQELLSRYVQVRVPDLERTHAERNDVLLASLAEETGGAYYRQLDSAVYGNDSHPPLPQLIGSRAEVKLLKGAPDKEFTRWQMQVLLTVIAGALFLEWIVRRLNRLA